MRRPPASPLGRLCAVHGPASPCAVRWRGREGCRVQRKPEVIVRVSYVTDPQEARAAQEILKIGLRRALAKLERETPPKDAGKSQS